MCLKEAAVEGQVVWRLRQRSREATVLCFDAVDFDEVSVSVSSETTFETDYDGRTIRMVWAEGTDLDDEEVSITWRVRNPLAGMYFIGAASTRAKPPYVAMFTDHETERARYWLPCIDHPSIRTSVTLSISTEAGVTHLGPGRQIQIQELNAKATTTWRLDEPCPAYLLCMAVGDFVKHEMSENGISLDVFGFEPMTKESLAQYFETTGQMMRWMVDVFRQPSHTRSIGLSHLVLEGYGEH